MADVKIDSKTIPAFVTPISAVSTDVGIEVTCNSIYASATIEVSAAGDITCKEGALGAETAANALVGATGVLAIATYATFGALVDAFNISAYWRARLVGVKRSDLFSSTNGVLITRTAAQCKSPVVVSLLRDTTVLLTATLFTIGTRISHQTLGGGTDSGIVNAATRIRGIGTSAGAHALKVYSCNELTKVDTLIWQEPLTSATVYEFNDIDFGALGAIQSKPGESLLIQHEADTATITSPLLVVSGYHKYLGNSGLGRAAMISQQ